MEDTITVKINDKDVQFGFLGRQFRIQAVEKIREHRHAAFKKAIADLPADPVSVASQVGSAIDAFMTSVIVEDTDINHWLTTPEGYYFSFATSLKKHTADAEDSYVEDMHDRLGDDEMGVLRDYWGRALDGSRYDDFIDRVRANVKENALAYFGASEEVLDAFSEWITAGKPKPRKKRKTAEKTEVPTEEATPEDGDDSKD